MKKKTVIGVLILVVAVAGIFLFFFFADKNSVKYSFSGDSFSYSTGENVPPYEISLNQSNGSVDVYNVDFQSRNFLNYSTRIYGLLFIPRNETNIPGLAFLPGGGETKDQLEDRCMGWANLGYAIFVIDQRGVGETGSIYLDLQTDYEVFAAGNEPIQHLSVYDGLAASDVLRNIKGIDKNNIAIGGEGMGGRYAVIAAALDSRLKGVIAISVSGFHIQNDSQPYTPYLLSIDPDNYIARISPRPVLILQGDNDTVVLPKDAEYTYNLAKEPKRFFIAQGCTHGYCNQMLDELKTDLKILFGK